MNNLEELITRALMMGGDNAYCGDPASASAEEGHESIGALADMLVTSILETWPELGG